MLVAILFIAFYIALIVSFLCDSDVGLVIFLIALVLGIIYYDNLNVKAESGYVAEAQEPETVESEEEAVIDKEESAINAEFARDAVIKAILVTFGIAIFVLVLTNIINLLHSIKFQLRKADEKLHKFCNENHVSLDYKVETDIIRMANDGVALYENLILDISRYKTFSALKTANTDSPEWMIWFFYIAQNNMIALSKDEMKSVAINYMSDLIALYKKYKEKYGLVDALNKLNECCWTDLTSDDIRRIKNIVESYKNNKDIKAKCRIPFKANSAELVEKYEK